MITVLLVLQAFITIALIGVVLIQRSEGGGLGLGTSQGMGSFMTGRGTANLLTRVTAVLATLFMVLSLVLALLYRHGGGGSAESILNAPPPASPAKKAAPASPLAPLPPIPGESTPATTPPAAPAPAAPNSAAPNTATPKPASPVPAPSKPAQSAPAPTRQ
ncbi:MULTISPECIES: preprotein translocase subunit SecG [Acidiphilium]|jgi:preprotein translocase subunit SecG|uniref:Protein-export membrane protein SecG n=2 Tax=Acidiphilium TaxID=522 RepID=A5FXW6_ACICJ|nr:MULTISPECIES: preprotein translocase subunit SecG [Acidiphilium]ABQ30448.1 protein translocase subunit secG [Acidiphilium cryptum JF-5]KDM65922.1 protein translocase subunit SecG [Acidiphilium sp. JA12-A1]MBS3024929.1 preprotein translocase subunit SecG [Acidiphilium multivorum]BAJ80625.1 protein translocase subunit SecG [Acidiphilium multivorum AIU301]